MPDFTSVEMNYTSLYKTGCPYYRGLGLELSRKKTGASVRWTMQRFIESRLKTSGACGRVSRNQRARCHVYYIFTLISGICGRYMF